MSLNTVIRLIDGIEIAHCLSKTLQENRLIALNDENKKFSPLEGEQTNKKSTA